MHCATGRRASANEASNVLRYASGGIVVLLDRVERKGLQVPEKEIHDNRLRTKSLTRKPLCMLRGFRNSTPHSSAREVALHHRF